MSTRLTFFLCSIFYCSLFGPVQAQMPAVGSACPTGSNEGSFAIGDIGSGEIALLVCDDDGASGGVYREWMSKTGSAALTVDNLTITGTCTGCDGGGGGGVIVPTDVKLSSSTHEGNFGSYSAMQTWVESNGCSGYKVCTHEDIVQYLIDGNSLPSSTEIAFVSTGTFSVIISAGGGKAQEDCLSWTTNNSGSAFAGWQLVTSGSPYPAGGLCSGGQYVLCCSF